MTYHAELAPRRRPWLIAVPLVLVVVLAAAWSAFWYYASRAAEARINDWQAQQAKAGRVFSCGAQTVGGYPFRIEVRCGDATVELRDTQPPVALKLKEILVVAQVWDPKRLIAEFTGPLTTSDPGQAPSINATWTLAQASVRGTPAMPERASIVADDLKLAGAAPGNPPLFDAKHVEFHARMQFGSWPHNPAVDLAVKLNAASAPALGPYTRDPLDADILAVLHGMKDLAPKPLPARLREWQAAGGRLEIQSARLAQGDALATATGTLALSQRGRLDGALQLNVAGLEKILPTLTGERKGTPPSLDRAAPALSAVDRAVPGLGARLAPQAQGLATGLLGLLGRPVEIEGKRGVTVPLRFTDGAASFGPIPLGQVPPAF
ncbi:MAG: DUF2125 domain-containing protein [Alphaproteobacteria bacterium]|nr:MAG: DUF2125 domain-containing protein [Alphaproteobacteria bacterium]